MTDDLKKRVRAFMGKPCHVEADKIPEQAEFDRLLAFAVEIQEARNAEILELRDKLQSAREEMAHARSERDTAENSISRQGYVRCDIAACNCNSWHPRGGLYARFKEIEEAVGGEQNGKTLLTIVKEVVAERDTACVQALDDVVAWLRRQRDDAWSEGREVHGHTLSSIAASIERQEFLKEQGHVTD